MVGPPSERELCLETMRIKVHWLRIGEPCKKVSIGFLISLHSGSARKRLAARSAFGFSGLPAHQRLAGWGVEGAKRGASRGAVLCE